MNGYQFDFDLLVVVNHQKLTDIAEYWYVADDRILRDEAIGRQANIIVHDLESVNQALKRGEYFWADIVRDGIVLYELSKHPLATPVPVSQSEALRTAERYFSDGVDKVDRALRGAQFLSTDGSLRDAVFTLHHAAERAYA